MRSIEVGGGWTGGAGRGPRRALYGALLSLALAGPASGQVGALVIRGLTFTGNHAFTSTALESVIATTNSSMFARSSLLRWTGLGEKRYFSERDFGRDVAGLALYYKINGYREVKVDTMLRRTSKDIYITFRITEGRPLRLERLDVVGLDSLSDAWRYRQDLPIVKGDVFSRDTLLAAADTLAQRLRNHGYPTATVIDSYDENVPAHTATATLTVRTGRRAVFGPAQITDSGDIHLDTAFVASLLAARQGQLYRVDDILRSQQGFYTTDLFRFASVGVDTVRFNASDSSAVPLTVKLVESRPHRAKASAGFGTDDCFRTGAGWTARNFPGNGLILDISSQVSKIGVGAPLGFGAEQNICSGLKADSIGSRVANYSVNTSLGRSAFLSPDNTLVLSLFGERRGEFEVYLRKDLGATLSLTRETAARIPITLTYGISYGSTDANAASFCAFLNTCAAADIAQLGQPRWQGTLTLGVTRQRVNNFLDPTRGTLMSFSATTSSRFLGSSSSQQFTRFVGDVSGFLPLSRTVVLAGHVRGGLIFAPKIDLSTGSTNFVPPDQRFYAGGSNDVRGYDQNELGPVVYVVSSDSVNPAATPPFPSSAVRVAATGGDRVVIGNLELRVPSPVFTQRLRLAVFADAGDLWNAGISTAPVRVTPGAGIRIASPLGPIRFDFAYNPYKLEPGSVYSVSRTGSLDFLQDGFVKDRTSRWTFHFGIGYPY